MWRHLKVRRMELTAAQTAVVADTHPLSLDTLGRVVGRLGMEIVARATRIAEVADLVEDHSPDLLVVGVDAVDAEVQQLVRTVRRRHPRVRLVVISDANPWSAERALAAGAHAYCSRTVSGDDLVYAIRQSFEGSIHLRPLAGPASEELESSGLTRREVEALQLVAEGHTNKQIAATLWVTEHTVKFHLSNIYRKLGIASRAEARRWADRHGLLEKPPPSR
jgi:DNA-binding NarL/FixJ family response regulator